VRRAGRALLALALCAARPATASEAGCPGAIAGAGDATFYEAIEANACLLPVAAGDLVTALAPDDFAGSAACGRCLRVAGPLGDVVVTVTDLCPGCSPGDLDLSPAAFATIADPIAGRVDVAWESVACDVAGPLHFWILPAGANPYYAEIQVRNARHGIAELAVASGGGFVPLPRQEYGVFRLDAESVPVPFATPFEFRVTDVHGAVVVQAGVPFATGVELPAAEQLVPCPEPVAAAPALGGLLALAGLARTPREARPARPRPEPPTGSTRRRARRRRRRRSRR
jgi:expansin (peptidoglycan-binding protein)